MLLSELVKRMTDAGYVGIVEDDGRVSREFRDFLERVASDKVKVVTLNDRPPEEDFDDETIFKYFPELRFGKCPHHISQEALATVRAIDRQTEVLKAIGGALGRIEALLEDRT